MPRIKEITSTFEEESPEESEAMSDRTRRLFRALTLAERWREEGEFK